MKNFLTVGFVGMIFIMTCIGIVAGLFWGLDQASNGHYLNAGIAAAAISFVGCGCLTFLPVGDDGDEPEEEDEKPRRKNIKKRGKL